MPNGHDREWVRLCGAVDGFYARYGRWPTELQIPSALLQDLKELFAPEDFAVFRQKVSLVTDPDTVLYVAADPSGARYCYNDEGFPDPMPRPSAREWFGITPLAHKST